MKESVERAVAALMEGRTLLYPTATVPGLGCDASNPEAVQEVIRLKGRSSDKGLIVLLDDDRKLHNYMKEVPEMAWDLIEHSTEPLTVIYPNGRNVAPEVLADDGSIAIRITRHPFCQSMLRRFRKAIVSTSANLSGQSTPANLDQVAPLLREKVGHIVDLPAWETSSTKAANASKIIKLELNGEVQIIRG